MGWYWSGHTRLSGLDGRRGRGRRLTTCCFGDCSSCSCGRCCRCCRSGTTRRNLLLLSRFLLLSWFLLWIVSWRWLHLDYVLNGRDYGSWRGRGGGGYGTFCDFSVLSLQSSSNGLSSPFLGKNRSVCRGGGGDGYGSWGQIPYLHVILCTVLWLLRILEYGNVTGLVLPVISE